MKSIQLRVNNPVHCWIIFEKEDSLPFVLPRETAFEAVENYFGMVESHRYSEKNSKFVTDIVIDSVLNFQLGYFTKTLLENGWVIIREDKDLMIRDKCE